MPGSLETITYQAQVLGKGSISTEPSQPQATSPFAADQANQPGGAGKKQGLASRSWSPTMRSPFKDALSRISRISRAGVDRAGSGGGSGLQSQGSDILPKMQFLQKAALTMRKQQQRHGASAPVGSKPPAGAGPAPGLHTVVEVRHGSVEGGAAEAAAAAARASSAVAAACSAAFGAAGSTGAQPAANSSAGDGQTQPQQQRGTSDRPASFELRATDVVLGNSSLRRRMLGTEEDVGAETGSPRAQGEGAAGFVARPASFLVGAGQLAHSGLKRRSQNYS